MRPIFAIGFIAILGAISCSSEKTNSKKKSNPANVVEDKTGGEDKLDSSGAGDFDSHVGIRDAEFSNSMATLVECNLVDSTATVEGDDEVHIFYGIENEDKKNSPPKPQRDGYLIGTNSGWKCYTLPEGMRPDIAKIHTDGKFSAIWLSTKGFHYAHGTAATFQMTHVPFTAGNRVTWSADFDSSGVAHVAFTGLKSWGEFKGSAVRYGKLSTAGFREEIVQDRDSYVNPKLFIAADSSGKVHILSKNEPNDHFYASGIAGEFDLNTFAADNIQWGLSRFGRRSDGSLVLITSTLNETAVRSAYRAISAADGFTGPGEVIFDDIYTEYGGFNITQDSETIWHGVTGTTYWNASDTEPKIIHETTTKPIPLTSGKNGRIHSAGFYSSSVGANSSGVLKYFNIAGGEVISKDLVEIVNTYNSMPIIGVR